MDTHRDITAQGSSISERVPACKLCGHSPAITHKQSEVELRKSQMSLNISAFSSLLQFLPGTDVRQHTLETFIIQELCKQHQG